MIRHIPAGVISEATFRLGYADAEAGYLIEDCPYVETMNELAWHDWRAGWRLWRNERVAKEFQLSAYNAASLAACSIAKKPPLAAIFWQKRAYDEAHSARLVLFRLLGADPE